MERAEAIKRIKAALQKRSGKQWSVTGGRGTAWGWLRIESPPKRRKEFGSMDDADRAELANLLDLEAVHHQGVSIPASSNHWQEYVDRAEGKAPSVIGERYWD